MAKGIKPYKPDSPWQNVHMNFTHQFAQSGSYELFIEQGEVNLTGYKQATENFKSLIQEAIQKNTTLRAMGSNWSFSKVAMCAGGVVQTKGLWLNFSINPNSVAPGYGASNGRTNKDLRFVQCGVQIATLNERLEVASTPRRCIRASGGSNGQTLAGVISTGTHGGAVFLGAVHDAVVGLHIITGPDKHVWLERASYPVASDEFINNLGATAMRDDDLFHAALVSFGSFGFINGVMIETDPLFLLKEHRFDTATYSDEIMQAFANVDVPKLNALIDGMPADTATEKLYHLEININPFKVKKGSKDGFYIRTFYKIPCPDAYVPDHQAEGDVTMNPDLIAFIEKVVEKLKGNLSATAIELVVNQLFDEAMKASVPGPRTIGEIFKISRFRGKIGSFAFAVDSKDLPAVIDHVLEVNKTKPFAGGLAVRFVKGTNATLGFTRYSTSCVVELDGVDTPKNAAVCKAIIERIQAHNISYTLHWGKLNDIMSPERTKYMYGEDRIKAWKQCREQLLSPETRAVFTNQFMINCGLDTPSGPVIV